MRTLILTFVIAASLTGSAHAQSTPSDKPKVELQVGYNHQKEYEGDTLNGGTVTMVLVKKSPVSLVFRAAGLYRNDDSHHFSGTIPVDVDGYTRIVLLAGGGRLEGRFGNFVPHLQVLVGVLNRAEASTTTFNGDVFKRSRSATAIYGDAGAGATVYLTPSIGVYGNVGFTPIIGGYRPDAYGYQIAAGLSFALR